MIRKTLILFSLHLQGEKHWFCIHCIKTIMFVRHFYHSLTCMYFEITFWSSSADSFQIFYECFCLNLHWNFNLVIYIEICFLRKYLVKRKSSRLRAFDENQITSTSDLFLSILLAHPVTPFWELFDRTHFLWWLKKWGFGTFDDSDEKIFFMLF